MTATATSYQNKTWEDVMPMVVSLLNDAQEGDNLYPQDKIITWWNLAQSHLSSIKPQQKAYHYQLNGNETRIMLPSDIYKPLYIIHGGAIINRVGVDEALANKGSGFYIFNKMLYFTSRAPGDFWLLYHAFYPDVVDGKSVVTVPTWALEACTVYTAMLAVTSDAIKDARYRRYLTRTDSGNPQQNPFIPIVEWLERRFIQIVNAHSDDDIGFTETISL